MTQPTVRVLQIDQDELTAFVDARLGSPVSAGATELTGLSDVTLDESTSSDYLYYDGATWVNQSIINAFTVGDGLDGDVWEGSPITIQVDSTVARRDATNTFQQANTFTAALVSNSSAAVVMNSAAPGLIFDESDAAADNQVWRIFAEGAVLTFDIRNDAGSTTNNWLTVGRSGATAGAIALFGTSLTFNGEPVIVGGSPYTGGGGGTLQSVTDSGNTTTNNLIIDKSGSPQTARFLALNNTAGASFDVTPTGALQINQTAAAGGDEKTWIAFARDGGVVLRYNDVNAISSVSGGVQIDDSIYQFQKNAANTDSGGFGQWWVKPGSPNVPMFTDENGVDHVLNDVTGSADNTFSGTNTFTEFWSGPGDGPIVLSSVGPTIEFTDTTTGDTAIIELSNTLFRFGTLSQGSPVGPGYDGLLSVGHNSGSPTDGLSLFDFAGFSGSFSLTGGDFDVSTSGNITLNAHTIANSLFVGTGSPALLATQTTSTDGVLSSVKIQDAEGLDVDVGFNQMLWKLKNATMGTTDDDWRSHAGHVTISDDGSAYTWTTPASTDGVVPSGATYTFANVGAGNITIAAGSGVTLTWLDGDTGGTGSRTLAQYGVATLSKRSATIWYVWGTGLT